MDEIVIKEFGELRKRGPVRIRVRVIRTDGRRPGTHLDLRTYVESAGFTGWTRKGLRLTAKEFSTLLELASAIQSVFEQSERPRNQRRPFASSPGRKARAR